MDKIKRRLSAIHNENYPEILDKKLHLNVDVGNIPKGTIVFGGYGNKDGVRMMWSGDCDWLEESQYSIVTALRKRDKQFIEDQRTRLW